MNEFEAILQDCTEALREGRADIAACLAKYPSHADELRPHLETAAALMQYYAAGPAVEPREEWAAASRERFLIATGVRVQEAFDEEPTPSFFASARVKFLMAAHRMGIGKPEAPQPRRVPLFGSAFRAVATLGAVVVMFMGFSMYTITSAQAALPGDWRYGVKLQTERVRLALAFSEGAERDVHIGIAAERAEEIEKLAAQGRIIPPGVIEDLRSEAEPLLAAVEEEKIDDQRDLARIQELSDRATTVLNDPEVRVAPDHEEGRTAAADTAQALSLAVSVVLVNADERPPRLTPTDPIQTPEQTETAEPTATPEATTTPDGTEPDVTPDVEPQPSPTPERTGLEIEETPVVTEGGITWIRLGVDNFTTLIPSPEDGWHLVGVNVTDGTGASPQLVRLANADSTQLITLNPRKGDMWWFIAVNGRFDEVQMRATRDGQAFGVDPELVRRLYGPLAELPLYVLDHIEFLPESEPTVTPETPATEPTSPAP